MLNFFLKQIVSRDGIFNRYTQFNQYFFVSALIQQTFTLFPILQILAETLLVIPFSVNG
jgi:hypothetical protein